MEQFSNLTHYQLLVVIANNHDGSKVLKIAKEHGIHGGTIVLGYGTRKRPILEFLELTDIKKEIVLMIADRKVVNTVIHKVSEKLKLGKKNTGILFVIPVSQFLGTGHYDYHENIVDGGHNMTIYKAIFTVVDKGKGSLVVESANRANAKGATIINARGSGIHETAKLFNMEIEPEKEIVLIVAKEEIVKDVVENIKLDLEIEKPGNGIIFIQEVHQTYGIR